MTKKVNRNRQSKRKGPESYEKRPALQAVGIWFACYLLMVAVFTFLLFVSTGALHAGGVVLMFLAAYPAFMWQKGRINTSFAFKLSAMTGIVASLAMTILFFMQH